MASFSCRKMAGAAEARMNPPVIKALWCSSRVWQSTIFHVRVADGGFSKRQPALAPSDSFIWPHCATGRLTGDVPESQPRPIVLFFGARCSHSSVSGRSATEQWLQ